MIIGICGGTGSGKTTIARKIIEAVKGESVILVEQDSYYRNLEDMPLDARRQTNFDQQREDWKSNHSWAGQFLMLTL